MRIKILNWTVILVFLFIFSGLLNMQLMQGKRFSELSSQNCIRLVPQEGSRGRVLDRWGSVIVDNGLSYNVMVSPAENGQVDKALQAASRILDGNFKSLKENFGKKGAVSFMPVTIARNVDIKKAIALEELKPELDNIMIQPYPLRSYPYARLACHVLGYLGEIDLWRLTKLANYGYKTRDIVGFGGIEEKYDYFLRQETGGLSVKVDHRGRSAGILGFRPPSNGKDIELTLDLRIQKIAEAALGGRKGSVIIMDPNNGQILAMANFPNFDPSIFVNKSFDSIARLFLDAHAPFINRAISGLYPAGSVFKPVVACAALETGKINSSKTYVCAGKMRIGNRDFRCWDTHNKQDLTAAIADSCDVFFYRTGLLLGGQAIYDYAVKFGFSRPTSVDLPYESGGQVPSPLSRKITKFKNWFDGDTANLSIGQGELLVTPLQVLRMTAAFANKGFLVNPYVVKSIDGQELSGQKRKTALNLKDSTINYIRQGMRKAVSDPRGTANMLSGLKVACAGKTGTAEVSRRASHGWFTGFFPYQEPKYAICVFLENGGSGHAATAVAKAIIEEMDKQRIIQ
ncbi:MAG: penicillin-binding protein 2 [Candidatus Omnitrophica bacterium]|nr:penicillin-binding protein 2 [Candidatus Omnitrophota bacterium]